MTPRYSLTIKRSGQREMRSLPADVLRSVHQAIQSNFSTKSYRPNVLALNHWSPGVL